MVTGRPTFQELWAEAMKQGRHLCVGLDPEPDKVPERLRVGNQANWVLEHMREVVIATAGVTAAYKPNFGFWEALGSAGLQALLKLEAWIHANEPDAIVILDGKRNDIGKTTEKYASSPFTRHADAVTVNGYLGAEALKAYLEQAGLGVFVLCRTSNPGAREIQDLVLQNGQPLYLEVASHVASPAWNERGNCGLVAGATYPDDIRKIRLVAPNLPQLIPGIGKQGGDLEAAIRAATLDGEIPLNAVINSSSGIIFSPDPGKAAFDLDRQIRTILAKLRQERQEKEAKQ